MAGQCLMNSPIVLERVAGIGNPIGIKRFEDGALAVIEIARSGHILGGGIGHEFVFELNRISDVETRLPRAQRDLQMNACRIAGKRLLVL